MQWILGHGLKLYLVIINIRYRSTFDFFFFYLCNIESTLKLNYEGTDTHMGPNGPHSKFIYCDDMFMRVRLALD